MSWLFFFLLLSFIYGLISEEEGMREIEALKDLQTRLSSMEIEAPVNQFTYFFKIFIMNARSFEL